MWEGDGKDDGNDTQEQENSLLLLARLLALLLLLLSTDKRTVTRRSPSLSNAKDKIVHTRNLIMITM